MMGSLEVSGGGGVIFTTAPCGCKRIVRRVSSVLGTVDFFEDKASSGVQLVQPPCASVASERSLSRTVRLDFKSLSPRMETPEPL